MKTVFYFEIPGEPKGKARPRFTRTGHTYTPQKTASYENLAVLYFRHAYPSAVPIAAGTEVTAYITAYYQPPQKTSKKKLQAMAVGSVKPTKKPDCDNIAKIILDSLNGIAYHDDAQVVSLHVEKRYAVGAVERPCVMVQLIAEVENENTCSV